MNSQPTEFHERLREAIRRGPLRQDELAAEIGAHRNSVSGWVTGRSKPSCDHLISMASLLDIDLNWLLCGAPRKDNTLSDTSIATTLKGLAPAIDELAVLARRLDEGESALVDSR